AFQRYADPLGHGHRAQQRAVAVPNADLSRLRRAVEMMFAQMRDSHGHRYVKGVTDHEVAAVGTRRQLHCKRNATPRSRQCTAEEHEESDHHPMKSAQYLFHITFLQLRYPVALHPYPHGMKAGGRCPDDQSENGTVVT